MGGGIGGEAVFGGAVLGVDDCKMISRVDFKDFLCVVS